ncbi:MAG: hypothetical protein KGJ02_04175 [Verrucomicrobiota bacterium]|nr:hypothetical protein [Verrucomicrobiota bacterium]
MRKFILCLFLVAVASPSFAQESPRPASRRGEAAGYSSRNATVLSMMGWGILLAGGIATICALLEQNNSSTSH